MIINSEVANLFETPGIQADIAANKPAANQVGIGTVYISTNTGTIERSNGTTWLNLGGGSPAETPGIDDVLTVNQALTGTQSIELAGNQFVITDTFANVYQFNPDGDFIIGKTSEATLNYEINPGSFEFYFQTPGGANGLLIDSNVYNFQIGDFDNQNNGNNFTILDQNNLIFFGSNGNTDGLSFDMSNRIYDIGNLTTNLTGFRINDDTQIITAQTNSGANGFRLDFSANKRFSIGDYNGIGNSTYIDIDDSNNTLKILNSTTSGYIELQANEIRIQGSNLQATSASGFSGQYLIVNVNGATYHIPLENP